MSDIDHLHAAIAAVECIFVSAGGQTNALAGAAHDHLLRVDADRAALSARLAVAEAAVGELRAASLDKRDEWIEEIRHAALTEAAEVLAREAAEVLAREAAGINLQSASAWRQGYADGISRARELVRALLTPAAGGGDRG